MDLFDYMRETKMESEAPLASRIRPRTLDEIVGQQHILAKDKLLYRAIKADKLSSVIFYGPPISQTRSAQSVQSPMFLKFLLLLQYRSNTYLLPEGTA